MNINKKVYILCPANSYTGGPTLAHQLCNVLNENGIQAFMWYYCNPIKKMWIDPVHPNYKHMNNPYIIATPTDDESNIIVALESKTNVLSKFKRAQLYIWWMSVDNYYLNMGDLKDAIAVRYFGFQKTIEYCMKYENKAKYSEIYRIDVTHLVQSEYARLFLKSKNISEERIKYLSDFLEPEILDSNYDFSVLRSDKVILYNPKKGYEFTKKLIEAAPQYEWVPLINLTKDQVVEKLRHSKLYVDFGNHPGKDRFPREAIMCGCCIITGRRGSAENDIDIPIGSEYKFEDIENNIARIISKIDDVLKNYYVRIHDFDEYRKRTRGEKDLFTKQALEIFGSSR